MIQYIKIIDQFNLQIAIKFLKQQKPQENSMDVRKVVYYK